MNKNETKFYNKGYYAGYRKATIDHLGGECEAYECCSTEGLEIHHIYPILRRARSLADLKYLWQLMLLCKKHHADRNRYKEP